MNNIPNQPIQFYATDEESCCTESCFIQKVEQLDLTQFQIQAENEIINGDFDGMFGWNVYPKMAVVFTTGNDTGSCNGTLSVSSTSGTLAPVQYSINGTTFQFGTSFTGLCAGNYFLYVKDANNRIYNFNFSIFTPLTCGTFAGSTLADLLTTPFGDIQHCTLSNFI
jgi:hypothetical protein